MKLQELTSWFNQRNARERALILAACLAVPWALWDSALMEPLKERKAQATKQVKTVHDEIRALETAAEKLAGELSVDLDADNLAEKDKLLKTVAELAQRLDDRTDDLIPPEQMTQMLKELLLRQTGLTLVRLESLPGEPLFAGERTASAAGALFKHGVVIEVRGDYRSTVRYLESIEELPWRFFWDSLDYEVLVYPEARVTLTLRSLSTDEGWVGV